MRRTTNWEWTVEPNKVSQVYSWDAAHASILMDIRDELQKLNRVFECQNALAIPKFLAKIERHLRQQLRCARHPRYTGRQPPRVNCAGCRQVFRRGR